MLLAGRRREGSPRDSALAAAVDLRGSLTPSGVPKTADPLQSSPGLPYSLAS
jgi:hypothetical protein